VGLTIAIIAAAAALGAVVAALGSWKAALRANQTTAQMLDAQRSGPRVATWETTLRDLSIYLHRKRLVMLIASQFFPVKSSADLAMAFKLIESAQARWRMVNPPHLVALVRAGVIFRNGMLVEPAESGEETA
jgi:hypothetical protein